MEHVFAPVGAGSFGRVGGLDPGTVVCTSGAAHLVLDQEVVARPAVDDVGDVAAMASGKEVFTAEAAYLVRAFLTGQLVWFVGTREQAAFGAAGYVLRGKDPLASGRFLEGPRPLASGFFGRRS